MDLAERARIVRLERKAFRAAKLPAMPSVDSAGISTRPWGARRMTGIGLSRYSGPSKPALDAWTRATRRKPRSSTFRAPKVPLTGTI